MWHDDDGVVFQSSYWTVKCTKEQLTLKSIISWSYYFGWVLSRAILWVIWGERNARVFEETYCSTDKLIHKIKEQAWGWSLIENTDRENGFGNGGLLRAREGKLVICFTL